MSNDRSSQQQNLDEEESLPYQLSLNEFNNPIPPRRHTISDLVPGPTPDQFYTEPLLPNQSLTYPQYYHNSDSRANMMVHRDMGYGYMPQSLQSYSAAQAYHSTLAAMPAYYDTSRYLSTSSSPSYLPELSYPKYSSPTEDREQIQKRRRRNSAERRHGVKLLSRKASAMQPTTTATQVNTVPSPRVPSIMGAGIEESPVQESPIDMFTTQASMQPTTYVTDQFQRAPSYERSPNLGNDYRSLSLPTYNLTTEALSSPSSYATAYTMASLNPSMSSLAPPPMIPSPSQQHTYPGSRHSSPLLGPMTPHRAISPHMEAASALDNNRRDKPQCWDHGCNGREFSTFSNLLRHQREKSGSAAKAYCPRCGAEFTRTTARNGHMEHGKCKGRRASATGSISTSQSGSQAPSTGGSTMR